MVTHDDLQSLSATQIAQVRDYAETGKLVLKHTAIALSQYEKVDLPDGDVEEQG